MDMTVHIKRRLGIILQDADLAAMLVDAGLDTPRKIKAAKDSEIRAIKGIGTATLAVIRERLRSA